MFFIVQEIPIPRFNRRMEQRCKYNHLHTIICNKQVLFLLNQCNIYKCLFSGIDLLFSPVPNASVTLYSLPHPHPNLRQCVPNQMTQLTDFQYAPCMDMVFSSSPVPR